MSNDLAIPSQQINSVRDILERARPQLEEACPNTNLVPRLIRGTLAICRGKANVLSCTPGSIAGCVMQAALLGLDLDPISGLAYIVPYGRDAQLIIGYKGLLALIRRSGKVGVAYAHEVYEGDQFDFEYGSSQFLRHKPASPREDKAKVTHVYACAHYLRDDNVEVVQFEVLTYAEIEKVRQKSKAKNSGPWVDHWDEMAKKTAMRRLAKWLPTSVEVQTAVGLDEMHDAGVHQNLQAQLQDLPRNGPDVQGVLEWSPSEEPKS